MSWSFHTSWRNPPPRRSTNTRNTDPAYKDNTSSLTCVFSNTAACFLFSLKRTSLKSFARSISARVVSMENVKRFDTFPTSSSVTTISPCFFLLHDRRASRRCSTLPSTNSDEFRERRPRQLLRFYSSLGTDFQKFEYKSGGR